MQSSPTDDTVTTPHLSSATGTVGSTSDIVILLKEMIELLLMCQSKARWGSGGSVTS